MPQDILKDKVRAMIYKNIKLLTTTAILLFFAVYTVDAGYTVKGQIILPDDWSDRVYLTKISDVQDLQAVQPDDFIKMASIGSDSSFKIEGNELPAEKGIYRLHVAPEGQPKTKIVTGRNYIYLILDDTSMIEVKGSAGQLTTDYELVEGDKANQQLHRLMEMRSPVYEYKIRANLQIKKAKNKAINIDSLKNAVAATYTAKKRKNKRQIKNFIDRVSTMPLVMLVGAYYYDDNNKMEEEINYFKTLDKRLQKTLPGNKHVKQFHEKVLEHTIDPVTEGDKMTDIRLKNVKGKTSSLNLINSELKIVYFWASWNIPSRQYFRSVLLPLYEKYEAEGLEVFTVAFDRSMYDWKLAVERYQFPWYNVIAKSRDQREELKEKLNIYNLPSVFIVDKKGKVIKKNLSKKELKQFVMDYFGDESFQSRRNKNRE